MKTILQFPYLAILFGLIALLTAFILVFGAPRWADYLVALFWVITGLLGLYQGVKIKS